jgi:hypothetical protein
MSQQIIPLTNAPNQSLTVTLNVDGANLTFNLTFGYNEVAGYWVMGIADSTGNVILAGVPLVSGDPPAANLLGQYAYLRIGSVYLLNVSGVPGDWPDDTNLGTDWVLAWADTPEYAV